MDIIMEIGREVAGAHALRVPSSFNRVGRHHAFLYWRDGNVTIKDQQSTNGTFVNGNRITESRIYENDIVWLGGNGTNEQCYKLDLRNIFSSCREAENAQHRPSIPVNPYTPKIVVDSPQNSCLQQGDWGDKGDSKGDTQRTDYSKEFTQIKQAYIGYHEELSKLKNKSNMSAQLPRVFLSMIPLLLSIGVFFVTGDMMVRMIAMSAGAVLSGLIGTLTMGKSSSRQEKMQEEILDLQLKYQKKYRCPKCGKEYSLDLHWKKLQADGKCPYGCGAEFV